jgi:outer membrane protein assembly factor BamE
MMFLRFLPFLLLAACSSAPEKTSVFSPYRIDVRQGNFVTQEMVAQLKPGMTRDQVRFVLGTPLVTDIFHADRWDYVYRFQPGKGAAQQRRITVYFEDDKLARVAGDVVGSDAGEAAGGAVPGARSRVIDIAPESVKKEEGGKKAGAVPEKDKK